MKLIKTVSVLLVLVSGFTHSHAQQDQKLAAYVDTLADKGRNPTQFILDKLDDFDLVIFDDALHTAVEPFEFYQDLVRNTGFREKVKYIFLEVVPVNQQVALDAYFDSETDDPQLLYPAFQNDFSGTGWPYKTYFDLLRAIWKVNFNLPANERFKVIAVNAPTYWEEIDTARDLELFRLAIQGNDYSMYRVMLSYLDSFSSGEKGIFVTNTRHAYKGIKNRDGKYYLNCGTFFNLYHPGASYSVRFHNINLRFEVKKRVDPNTPRTTEGLENVTVGWVRMEDGLWDSAFEVFGNKPVAFDMKDTPFGQAPYIGNHMLNVAPGQTMYDAYDALVFLAPVEDLRKTAMVDFIYTDEFKRELERRYKILYTGQQIEAMLSDAGVDSLGELVSSTAKYQPETVQPLVRNIGPVDAWKN